MPRHLRLIFPVILLPTCVLFSGCDTVYSDMYSPTRSYFVPPKEKKKLETPIPIEEPAPAHGQDVPGALIPPAPSSAPVLPVPGAPAEPPVPGIPPPQ